MATDWQDAAAPINRGPEPGGVGAIYRVFGETLSSGVKARETAAVFWAASVASTVNL